MSKRDTFVKNSEVMSTATTAIPQVNYVTDSTGKRVSVQISIEMWESLIERLEFLSGTEPRGISADVPNASLISVPEADVTQKTNLPQKQLSSEKITAELAAARWKALSEELPDVPEIGLDEIVAEVKAVRKLRSKRQNR